jgi:RHS repeat-associated protein
VAALGACPEQSQRIALQRCSILYTGMTYYQEYDAENRLVAVTNTVTSLVTRFAYDGDGNRVKVTAGTTTTVYVGNYYEKQGTTVTRYYYLGGQRVAMRVGPAGQAGTLAYLHGDHLGSTSLATSSSGGVVARQRYYPYGAVRPGGTGTLPTDYTFTGQKDVPGTGLMYYGARYYEPALGRFISADTIVPEPGNPQDLNRYTYVRNNPLRYIDATGYYSEEEIMRAFGASTWDEVLGYFQERGALEGRWGWLETLRQAEDGDLVISRNPGDVGWYRGALWPLECSEGALCGGISGTFGRNGQGEILVSGIAHSEFALQGNEYALYERGPLGHSDYASFYTRAEWIHYHTKYDWDRVDKEDVALDAYGIGLSLLEAVPTFSEAAMTTGWVLDSYSISKDLKEWHQTGQPWPWDAPGIWGDLVVDAIGMVPGIGAFGDLAGILLGSSGGIYWTP